MSVLALLLAFGAAASPAAAATTADFQANCSYPDANGNISCVFDARRQSSVGPGTHCNSGSITQYFWDLDDPNNDGVTSSTESFWTTSPLVSAVYRHGPNYEPYVVVFCSDNTSDDMAHCFPTTFGFNGCIRANGSWTP